MLFNLWLGTTVVVAIFCVAQLLFVKWIFPKLFGRRDMGFKKFTATLLVLGYLIAEVMLAVCFGAIHLLIQSGVFN